jgi:hypothetical protein
MADLKNTVIADVGSINLPSGTTAQRPTNPPAGATRFNTDLGYTECFFRGYWFDLTTGAGAPAPGALAHLESTVIESNTGSGTTWFDLTGNGHHFALTGVTRTTSTPGAVFQTAGNTGSYMESTPTSGGALNFSSTDNGYSVIACQRYTGSGVRGRMLNGRANNWLLGHWGDGCTNHYAEGWIYGADGGGEVVNDTSWRVHGCTGKTGADFYDFWIDGQRVAGPNDTGGSQGPNGFVVGKYGLSFDSEFSAGEISTIIIYDRALTPDEMKQTCMAVMKKNNTDINKVYAQG